MVAMAGLLLPVIGWERTRDPQAAGHNQDPVDLLGGHWPAGLQVHAPRVSKAPNDQSHPREGMPADRLHGSGSESGPPTVSRLSATIHHAASRRTTAPFLQPPPSRADVMPSKAAEGCVK